MADWKDILSENDEQLSEEELLKYLDDETSEVEKFALEKKLNNNPFNADAIEGLSQINSKEKLEKHVSQLNLKLQQLTSKKPRKQKQKIKIFEWMILAVVLLLFICVIGYVIIHLHNKVTVHTCLPFINQFMI